MSIEPTHDTSAVVVAPETSVPAAPTSEVKQETVALLEAIKKRAQAELLSASELTRETYLNAVRQMRESIEQDKLIDRDRIEESIQHFQTETEKNWNSLRTEIEDFGNRISEAAKTAWDTLTHPKDSNGN